MKVLFAQKKLADMLGISLRTLERMRSDGSGPPFIRASGGARKGRVLYSQTDVEAWLNARRRLSTSDPGKAEAA